MKNQNGTSKIKFNTNFSGRVKNTNLSFSHGLMPLFEAIINSIHAIEESKKPVKEGLINIEICENPQPELMENKEPFGIYTPIDIVGFKIEDNGIGFTDKNMESFLTLDSDYKANKGSRGVGRLIWLKAFKKVEVSSYYKDENNCQMYRKFYFDRNSGIDKLENSPMEYDSENKTTIHLDGFIPQFKRYAKKTLADIANAILEHCLWYFVREDSVPIIYVSYRNEKIELGNIFHGNTKIQMEREKIKEFNFNLIHAKLYNSSSNKNAIALCADDRLVENININGKIPGLYGKIKDSQGDFIYACYVFSDYLNENVSAERTDFDIDDSTEEGDLLEDLTLSKREIVSKILKKVKIFLSDYLEANLKNSKNRIENFVSGKAPRYKPILHRIPEDKLHVDPSTSDKDLEIILHKLLMEIENELLTEGCDILNPTNFTKIDEYKEKLKD